MRTEYKCLSFDITLHTGGVPSRWTCYDNKLLPELGCVEWDEWSQRFCFMSAPLRPKLCDGCLRDIADFIEQLKKQKEQGNGND